MTNRTKAGVAAVAAVGLILLGAVVGFAASSPGSNGSSPAATFIDQLAGILHLSPQQTQSDLKQAEINTINQMVKDGRLTPAEGQALKQRVESGQGVPFFGGRSGSSENQLPGLPGGFRVIRQVSQAEVKAVAGALGLSQQSLISDLRSGKTLSQLETAKGVSNSTVKAAAVAAAKKVLDSAVSSKELTRAQANQILQRVEAAPVPFGAGPGPHIGWHGFGPWHPMTQPAVSTNI